MSNDPKADGQKKDKNKDKQQDKDQMINLWMTGMGSETPTTNPPAPPAKS
jgi:hypothetical protein